MLKLQDALLKAMAKQILWWQAADIIGVTDRTILLKVARERARQRRLLLAGFCCPRRNIRG
jgi:hypothetical protein